MSYNFSTPVNNYSVLIADPDRKLANVIRTMLKEMDLSHIEITHSGARARELIHERTFDILITEWDIEDIDGLELINHIRNDPDSPNPRMPIIMLTDRTEQADVALARDTGINEFIVKPFSAKILYEHVEHIIAKRRAEDEAKAAAAAAKLAAAEAFARKKAEQAAAAEAAKASAESAKAAAAEALARQKEEQQAKRAASQNKAASPAADTMPINPALLNNAQASIEAITAESLQWIKEDLAKMKALHQKMVAGETNGELINELSEVTENINEHAGKSGYARAAEITNELLQFFRTKIQPGNSYHLVVVQKHIEVLQVIFGNNIVGMGGNAGEAIAAELHNLTRKYAS